MNINRRSMFRRLAAIPLAVAGIVVAKPAMAGWKSKLWVSPVYPSSEIPTAAPPVYQPPPPDNRTPREVWQERENSYNKWLDGVVDNSPEYRTFNRRIEHVSGRSYLKLKDRLLARGIKPEELIMGGDTFMVIHGNLYTIGQWW